MEFGAGWLYLKYVRGRAVLALGRSSLAAEQDDPSDVLIRLRDPAPAQAQRIPNHTCFELVRRDQYEAVAGPPARSCDTLLARARNLKGSRSSAKWLNPVAGLHHWTRLSSAIYSDKPRTRTRNA